MNSHVKTIRGLDSSGNISKFACNVISLQYSITDAQSWALTKPIRCFFVLFKGIFFHLASE